MQSVFQTHGQEIATYEVGGIDQGRLLFAMAILSDCQEMLMGPDNERVRAELNEAKELMSSIIVRLNRHNKPVNVVVTMYDGIIDDVFIYHKGENASRKFQECTGISFQEFTERLKQEDTDSIIGDYAGTNIWEVMPE